MDYLKNLIGRKARRVTFRLQEKDSKTYYLLLSVIEILQPDMQDCDFPADNRPYCRPAKDESNEHPYRISMTIDWVTLDEDFLKEPHLHYVVDGEPVKCYNDRFTIRPAIDEPPYVLRGSYDNDGDIEEIQKVLPKRQCSKYLHLYLDDSGCALAKIQENDYVQKQLSQLSLKYYGTDLSLHPQFIGGIFLVQYNPVFRLVDIAKSVSPAGLFVNFHFRPGVKGNLLLRVTGKSKEGFYSYEKDFEISTAQSEHFIELPSDVGRPDLKVFDDYGNFIYYYDDMPFIAAVRLYTSVASSRVRLRYRTRRGEIEDTVDKYITESSTIGEVPAGEIDRFGRMSPNAYKCLENSLVFVFFDGEKQNKDANVKKAKSAVKRILGKARERCIICDPYFSLNDLREFVFTMPHMEVSVRILASDEFICKMHEDGLGMPKLIDHAIKEYTEKGLGDVQFRLLKGNYKLHDRIIIVDDSVWLLGSSFNEFGNRATSIVQVPKEACKHLCETVELWWKDDECSISLMESSGYNRQRRNVWQKMILAVKRLIQKIRG